MASVILRKEVCKQIKNLRNSITLSRFLASNIEAFKKEEDTQVTHTGQYFEKDDYRLARFVGREKQINPRFAIDLVDEVPPIKSKSRIVACNGGGGPLGHPTVYINLDKPGIHTCMYCGLRYYRDDDDNDENNANEGH